MFSVLSLFPPLTLNRKVGGGGLRFLCSCPKLNKVPGDSTYTAQREWREWFSRPSIKGSLASLLCSDITLEPYTIRRCFTHWRCHAGKMPRLREEACSGWLSKAGFQLGNRGKCQTQDKDTSVWFWVPPAKELSLRALNFVQSSYWLSMRVIK